MQEGLKKLLNADADVNDIIDNVLAGDGNATATAGDDFAFKKPMGRAPRAKKQKAPQTTFYSRKGDSPIPRKYRMTKQVSDRITWVGFTLIFAALHSSRADE